MSLSSGFQPYDDDPGNFGLEVANPETLMKDMLEADKRGLQVSFLMTRFCLPDLHILMGDIFGRNEHV